MDNTEFLDPPGWNPVSGIITGTGQRMDFVDPSPLGMASETYSKRASRGPRTPQLNVHADTLRVSA